MPTRSSARAKACEPRISASISRQSKSRDSENRSKTSDGPVSKRPPQSFIGRLSSGGAGESPAPQSSGAATQTALSARPTQARALGMPLVPQRRFLVSVIQRSRAATQTASPERRQPARMPVLLNLRFFASRDDFSPAWGGRSVFVVCLAAGRDQKDDGLHHWCLRRISAVSRRSC